MKSLSLLVPDSKRADANKLMEALNRGPSTFIRDCSPSRTPVATHWGAHTYDDQLLNIIETRTLPGGINWSAYGLTQTKAQQALDAIRFKAVNDMNSVSNFDALGAENGVGTIRRPIDA